MTRVLCRRCRDKGYFKPPADAPRFWTRLAQREFVCRRCAHGLPMHRDGEHVSCSDCGTPATIIGYGTKPSGWSTEWLQGEGTQYQCTACAARRRGERQRVPIVLPDGTVLTASVERRLRKQAERTTPKSRGYRWFGWLGVGSSEHQRKIGASLATLAQQRRQLIEDRDAFYSSSEWRAIRRKVIDEDGRRCASCVKTIVEDDDLTVDHIKPRSRFPQLALERSNLQVLCRSCNSAKGTLTVD